MDCASTVLNLRVTYVNGALWSMVPEYNMNGAPWRCAPWKP